MFVICNLHPFYHCSICSWSRVWIRYLRKSTLPQWVVINTNIIQNGKNECCYGRDGDQIYFLSIITDFWVRSCAFFCNYIRGGLVHVGKWNLCTFSFGFTDSTQCYIDLARLSDILGPPKLVAWFYAASNLTSK